MKTLLGKLREAFGSTQISKTLLESFAMEVSQLPTAPAQDEELQPFSEPENEKEYERNVIKHASGDVASNSDDVDANNQHPIENDTDGNTDKISHKHFILGKPVNGILSSTIYERCELLEGFSPIHFKRTPLVRPAGSKLRVGTEVFVCKKWLNWNALSVYIFRKYALQM